MQACEQSLMLPSWLLQATRPRAIVDLIHSAENFRIELGSEGKLPQPKKCERCGYICSQSVCKACQLLEGLNKGLPSMGISRPNQVKTRTASKLAAAKLRAQQIADAEQADTNGNSCRKAVCACAAISGTGSSDQNSRDVVEGMLDAHAGNGVVKKYAAGEGDVAECNGSSLQHSGDQDTKQQQQQQQQQRQVHGACNTVCDCAAVSHRVEGMVCNTNEDWAMPSNFTEANDARNPSSDMASMMSALSSLSTVNASLHADSPVRVHADSPVRVHGKLYEGNLREIDAHPSARRPVQTNTGISW